MLSTNQIAILFDHQYLWNEPTDNVDFLYGDNHEGKVASETTTFGWVSPVVLVQSYVILILFDYQYLWKKPSDILDFFAWS